MVALRGVLCLLYGSVLSVQMTKNPIRKVVTLMQNMQKEVEVEGEKAKEINEKFLCYCKDSFETLTKANADAAAAAEDFSSKVKAESATKNSLALELTEHKKDREAAKGDLEEATALRNKEAAEFAASKADSETNIVALGSAIPAIEKGMSGAAFMQMPGGRKLRQIVDSYSNLEAMDRRDVMAFLDQSEDYTPASGQIVGILKQMLDEFQANLKSASDEEAQAVASFTELSSEKSKEIDVATEQIESKMARSGQLAVSIVQAKDGFDDNSVAAEDAAKTLAALKVQCAAKEKAYSSASKDRADEIAALSEAVSVLNDDDALDVFKKAVPGETPAADPALSFLQRSSTHTSRAQKALHVLHSVSTKSSPQFGLVFAQLKSKLTSKHGAKKFEDIAKMIDSMVTLLGKQQDEDDKQKEWCRVEFGKADDEQSAAKTKLASVEAALEELTDAVETLTDEIAGLTKDVQTLDYTVAEATLQRKTEHQAYVEAIQMQSAAIALIGKAKKKLEKFYKPALVQSPVSFVQVRSRSSEWALEDSDDLNQEVADAQAQEAASKSEVQRNAAKRASGVLALMDHIIHQTEMATKDSENDEKSAQTDYAEMMSDAQETRAADVQSISDKSVAKAGAEKKLVDGKETHYLTQEGLLNIAEMTSDLHSSCDFLVENYDIRKEARGNEMDSLKNAKVILS